METKRYRVLWNYRAGARGPWLAGDTVELSDADAAAVQVDSPGVLAPVGAPAAPVADAAARVVDAPPIDRAMRGPGRRRQGAAV